MLKMSDLKYIEEGNFNPLNADDIKNMPKDEIDKLIHDHNNLELHQFILRHKIHANDLKKVEEILDSIALDTHEGRTFTISESTLPIYLTMKQIKEMDDYAIAMLYWDYIHLQVDSFHMKYCLPAKDYDKLHSYMDKRGKAVTIPRWVNE